MTREGRIAAVLRMMQARGVDLLAACTGGLHFIDGFDPVAHLTGFRSTSAAILLLRGDGSARLVTTPPGDAERVAQAVPWAETAAVDDILPLLRDAAPARMRDIAAPRAGWVGRGLLPWALAEQGAALLPGEALDADFMVATARKTVDEIAAARRATAIAEQGMRYLLEIAKPGMPECDLAVQVNLHMRALGANDSFLMLNCGPRAPAVMPSSRRPMQLGDVLLTELSPSVDGQFVQICRTAMIGEPTPEVSKGYGLLVDALQLGLAAVRPGARMSDVCAAIDDHLSAAGYAAYSRPPHIRRRGHGLGCGTIYPGDVAMDNQIVLEPGMLFVVHPNQFLPETGYMMCGEPVVVTETGVDILSTDRARLFGIAP